MKKERRVQTIKVGESKPGYERALSVVDHNSEKDKSCVEQILNKSKFEDTANYNTTSDYQPQIIGKTSKPSQSKVSKSIEMSSFTKLIQEGKENFEKQTTGCCELNNRSY